MTNSQLMATNALKRNARNARTHSKKQIRQIAGSIAACGFVSPIVADEHRIIIAGHGRWEAAKLLGLEEVPVIVVQGLSEAKRRALALADNRLAENAGWDRAKLALELPELSELLIEEGLDISLAGFEAPEIDQLTADFEEDPSDPADAIDPAWATASTVSAPGDLWLLGSHRMLCGDARSESDITRLMDGAQAAMAFLDPPYNVHMRNVVGRGRIKHRDFRMGSGELSRPGFIQFLKDALGAAAAVSRNGAVHFICIDWRHVGELLESADKVYGETLNIAVWVKSNAGQGSLYRSQHELVAVFRVGGESHLNNVELGRHGRSRSNVWHYAGTNSFRAGRLDDLRSHPTVKPVALVADTMKDVTRRGDVILDSFCGSGTTVLAAERVGRKAYTLELEPCFVDIAIKRWQAFTRRDAIHVPSGLAFDELAIKREVALVNAH